MRDCGRCVVLTALTLASLAGAALAQVRAGGEFRLNSATGTVNVFPQVTLDPRGGFVAVWARQNGPGAGVVGRRFDRVGAARGAEFTISSATTSSYFPALGGDGTGRFVVAWENRTNGGQQSHIL